MSDNIRAVDIGYGNVKLISNRTKDNMVCKLFPALAPKSAMTQLAGDFVRKRDTKVVLVDGIHYEVGQDAKLAQKGTETGRQMREDYCLSDQYRALVFGALMHMTRAAKLDILVLGLPVNTYQGFKDRLAANFTGTFNLDGDKAIEIKKCLVVPQPLGGFFDYAVSNRMLTAMSKGTTLVIDPGFCTLDWLVAEGTTPLDARSGARAHGGMNEVMREVMEQVARDAGVSVGELGQLERIDTALREGTPLKFAGRILDVRSNDDYIRIAQRRAADAFQELLDTVGSSGDIDNVLLVGGGSHVYEALVKKSFPHHEIRVVSDAVYSNVRGFQLLGEMWAKKNGGK